MQPSRLPKWVLVGLLISAAALGACTRSASTPPSTPAAIGGTPSTQNWQQQTMEAVRFALLTQTAQALPAGGGGEAATSTPTSQPATTPQPTSATQVVIATAFPTATPGRPSSYTLHEGEYPFCLARRFNVDPGELMAINGIASGEATYPGQVLRIPQTGNPFPAQRALRSHPTTYTVQSGDTIYFVACLFGDVDPMAIVSANNLTEPYTLTPGSLINIP
ncbi:MAG: LysM peptidoglycan-binding domain-containing protein [Chloroflexota bacterium]